MHDKTCVDTAAAAAVAAVVVAVVVAAAGDIVAVAVATVGESAMVAETLASRGQTSAMRGWVCSESGQCGVEVQLGLREAPEQQGLV